MNKCLLSSLVIAFAMVLIPVYIHAEIDQRDFDGDGDVDAYDLSVFAEKYGSIIWYKDFDGDLFSDGSTEYSVSQPTDYYLESELTAITGDCDDEDANVNPGMDEICGDGLDNDCDALIDEDCATDAYLVINEIDYDQVGVDALEFVEIMNIGGSVVNLTGLRVEFINGLSQEIYLSIDLDSAGQLPYLNYLVIGAPGLSVPPSAHKIYFLNLTNNIQNGPDCVRIVGSQGIIDSVSYEGSVDACNEGFTSVADTNTEPGSIGRMPNGADSNDNALDFYHFNTPTPGGFNDY